MEIQGHITYAGDGLGLSTKAMLTQMTLLNVHTDNIANFGVPGYQRKDPVITSFVEFLGPQGVEKVTSMEIGRLRKSGNPLDTALNTKGYFQKLNPTGGVELTRDGRFQLDRDGYLRALDGKQILSSAGIPVRFPMIPQDLEKQVKISANGEITIYDPKKGEMLRAGALGVVSSEGSVMAEVDVKQGYVEDSNVYLQKEYTSVMPIRRQFEANRQLFIMQSDQLTKMIQELGRAQ